MATTTDDLEAFLHRLDRSFERGSQGTYVVSLGPGRPPALLRLAPPVLVVQVEVGAAPSGDAEVEAKLFRKLLELNASELVYVAFGLDHGRIVLDAALDLTTMGMGELESVLANLDLTIAEHVPELRELVRKG